MATACTRGAGQGDRAGDLRRAVELHRHVAELRRRTERGADRRMSSARWGGCPEDFVLATKLDRDPRDQPLRCGGDAPLASRQSLEALGVDRVGLLHFHDPEYAADLDEVTKPGGGLAELYKIRDEGLCDAVGLAAGRVDVMMPILERFDFDAMITHNRFTLVNRNAEAMIDYAQGKGIAVVNAAPFAGGVFARGSAVEPALRLPGGERGDARSRCGRWRRSCARYGVPLGRGGRCNSRCAIRASPRPSAASGGPKEIDEIAAWANWPIPPRSGTKLRRCRSATTIRRRRGTMSRRARRSGGLAAGSHDRVDHPRPACRRARRSSVPGSVDDRCRAGSSPSRPPSSVAGTLRFEARLPSS